MLTNHKYIDIDVNWDQETILECCKSNNNPDDPCTDCCYDSWQNELKKVITAYNQAVESAIQLQNTVNFISDRRDRYKNWLDELVKAEKLSVEVCYQLNLIAIQSDKIWFNSCKAEEAIEIFFCMIRDIFNQVDKIKSIYDNLQGCITRINDPSLVPGQGILQALNDYKLKLDAVIKTRDEIIKAIIDAVRLANLIRNNISTRDCPCEDDEYDPCSPDKSPCTPLTDVAYYGFKTIICEWYNAFACDDKCPDSPAPTMSGGRKYSGSSYQGHDHDNDDHRNDDCCLEPTFEFPICKNTFKSEVEGWLQSDEALLKTKTELLNKTRIEKETLLACKTSLENAIKATDPKLRCK